MKKCIKFADDVALGKNSEAGDSLIGSESRSIVRSVMSVSIDSCSLCVGTTIVDPKSAI